MSGRAALAGGWAGRSIEFGGNLLYTWCKSVGRPKVMQCQLRLVGPTLFPLSQRNFTQDNMHYDALWELLY
jgi:hypothetical protein